MRAYVIAAALMLATGLAPAAEPAPSPSCADDYLTIEHISGEIVEIKPAPEPFPTADIDISGPKPCERMWMQVLKADAANCRAGDKIDARGVITSDAENNSWQINPLTNAYMMLGDDYRCHS